MYDPPFLPHSPLIKGGWGIVFTHGVRMGRQVGEWQKKVYQGCIPETVRCRKLIVGRAIGWGLCTTSLRDLDLTFDLGVVS